MNTYPHGNASLVSEQLGKSQTPPIVQIKYVVVTCPSCGRRWGINLDPVFGLPEQWDKCVPCETFAAIRNRTYGQEVQDA